MIVSFKSKKAEQIWQGNFVKNFPTDIQKICRRKLRMLNNTHSLIDLKVPPSNMLEPLHGDREGTYSIRVNKQWRICFRWKNNNIHDVEIVDYH